MWKTIRYTNNGKPLWDINEQGKLYSYREKKLNLTIKTRLK